MANGQTVWGTPTGKSYHSNPSHGGATSYELSLGWAWNQGLTPCGTCRPPMPELAPPKPEPLTETEVRRQGVEELKALFAAASHEAPSEVELVMFLTRYEHTYMDAWVGRFEDTLGVRNRRATAL